MDEQPPQSVQQIFDKMIAAILQRNDSTEPVEQSKELRRVVLDSADLPSIASQGLSKMPMGISIGIQRSGIATAQITARAQMLKLSRDLCYTAVKAFADNIEQNAPRATGYMAKRIATIKRLSSRNDSVGYGAGAYELIGAPGDFERGTITRGGTVRLRPRTPGADHPWRRGGEQYRLDQQLAADRKAYAAVNP